MRKFPYYCLDCEAVFDLERFDIGVTCCPKCGRRRIVPLGAVFPLWKALREVEAKRLAEKRKCLLTGRTLCTRRCVHTARKTALLQGLS